MRKLLLSLLILISLVSGLSAQKQYILKSKHVAKPDTIWVFVPSSYNANQSDSYPLVYLLHGWSGNYHQWNDIMGCQEYADRYGFIIVCPDGLYDSWYINSPAIKESQYADFFFMDLVPFIGKTYRVDNDNIFITGLSMGGHGALYLFEQRPEIFRSAGSLSGVLDLSRNLDDYRISDYLGLKKGGPDLNTLKVYSVSGNIEKIAHSGKEIIFICGTSDPFYAINNEFRVKCDEIKMDATYISNPGAHNYPYWKSNIGTQFEFFKNKLQSH